MCSYELPELTPHAVDPVLSALPQDHHEFSWRPLITALLNPEVTDMSEAPRAQHEGAICKRTKSHITVMAGMMAGNVLPNLREERASNIQSWCEL